MERQSCGDGLGVAMLYKILWTQQPPRGAVGRVIAEQGPGRQAVTAAPRTGPVHLPWRKVEGVQRH